MQPHEPQGRRRRSPRLPSLLPAILLASLCLAPSSPAQATDGSPPAASATTTDPTWIEVTDLVRPVVLKGSGKRFAQRLAEKYLDFGQQEPDLHTVPLARQLFPVFEADGAEQFNFRRPNARYRLDDQLFLQVMQEMSSSERLDLELARDGARLYLISASPERARTLVEELRSSLPPAVQLTARLLRIEGTEQVALIDEQVRLADGAKVTLGETRRRTIAFDYGTVIVDTAASLYPAETVVQTGTSLGLRTRMGPFGESVLVECFARRSSGLETESAQFQRGLGSVEKANVRIDEGGSVLRLRNGDPQSLEWTTLEGAAMRLELRAVWDRPTWSESAPRSVFTTQLLKEPVGGFAFAADAPQFSRLSIADLFGRPNGGAGEPEPFELLDSKISPAVAYVTPEPLGPADLIRLRRRFDRALEPVTVTMEFLDVPASLEIPSEGELPARVRTLGRVRGSTIAGLPMVFDSGREQSYVGDATVQVKEAARIVNPKVELVESGWFASIMVSPKLPNQPRSVVVHLDQLRLHGLQQRELVLSQAVYGAGEKTKVLLQPNHVTLEYPDLSAMSFDQEFELDENGMAVLTQAAPEFLGKGRRFVIRLRVE